MYEVGINCDFGKSKKNSIKTFLSQNKLLVFLAVCLLLGVFCGSVLVKYADQSTLNFINILFSSDIQERASKASFDFFITSLSSIFLFLLVSFFIGLSMYGFTFTPLIPFLRGICIGMSELYLYSSYGIKGLFLSSLIFLPGMFISSLTILLAAKEATCMSNKLSILAVYQETSGVSLDLKRYFARNGIIAIFAVVSAAIDLLANLMFAKFFNM